MLWGIGCRGLRCAGVSCGRVEGPPGDESDTDWLSPWPLLGAGQAASPGRLRLLGGEVGAAGFFDSVWRWLTGPIRPIEQWNLADLFGSGHREGDDRQVYRRGRPCRVYDDGIDKSVSALMTHYDASRANWSSAAARPIRASWPTTVRAFTARRRTASRGRSHEDRRPCHRHRQRMLPDRRQHLLGDRGSNMSEAIRQMAISTSRTIRGGGSTSGPISARGISSRISPMPARTGAAASGRCRQGGGQRLADGHRDAATQELNVDRHVITVAPWAAPRRDHLLQRGASLLTSAPGGTQFAGITTPIAPARAGYVNGDINPSFTGTWRRARGDGGGRRCWARTEARGRDVQAIVALASHDNETAASPPPPPATWPMAGR